MYSVVSKRIEEMGLKPRLAIGLNCGDGVIPEDDGQVLVFQTRINSRGVVTTLVTTPSC